jgi:membrane protease YdiL (CAAX protease family)
MPETPDSQPWLPAAARRPPPPLPGTAAIGALGATAGVVWALLWLLGGPFDRFHALNGATWELLLEAKVVELARAAAGDAAGVGAEGDAARSAAVAELVPAVQALPAPAPDEPGAGAVATRQRELRLRLSALAALTGRWAEAAGLARTGASEPLAGALEAAAASPDAAPGAAAPLGPAEVAAAADEVPAGAWTRARLAVLLAEAAGTPEAQAAAAARYEDVARPLAARAALLGGTLALAGLVGLALLVLAPWWLRRWLRRGPTAAPWAAFQGGAPVAATTFLAWFLAHAAAGPLVVLVLGPLGGSLAAPTELALQLAALTVATGAAGLLLIAWLAAPGQLLDALGARRAPDGRAIRWALGAAAVAVPAVVAAAQLNEWLVGPEPLPTPVTLLTADPGPVALGLLVLATVGLAPLFEEAVFRGYLYPVLRGRLGVPPAAAVTGFAFALVHVQPGNLLPLTVLGVLFALVREATGTLWAPVLCHALWNLGSLAMAGFVFG